MFLIDSDHLSVLLESRDSRQTRLMERIEAAPERCAIPIVVIEEHLRSWLAQIHRATDVHRQIVPYLRLRKVIEFLVGATIVDWNEPAADHFVRLRYLRNRVGSQDLKIACIALANNAPLLTANLRDFEQVPGLRVEDWLES
jgi:tRNA(fMet)-specific endonuclease VapC